MNNDFSFALVRAEAAQRGWFCPLRRGKVQQGKHGNGDARGRKRKDV